jgi:hypothetical protein
VFVCVVAPTKLEFTQAFCSVRTPARLTEFVIVPPLPTPGPPKATFGVPIWVPFLHPATLESKICAGWREEKLEMVTFHTEY